MVRQINARESLIQNLKDAGCSSDMIERFMACHEQDHVTEMHRILSKQRYLLLEAVHDSQRRLDCLDYLIYQLKK